MERVPERNYEKKMGERRASSSCLIYIYLCIFFVWKRGSKFLGRVAIEKPHTYGWWGLAIADIHRQCRSPTKNIYELEHK